MLGLASPQPFKNSVPKSYFIFKTFCRKSPSCLFPSGHAPPPVANGSCSPPRSSRRSKASQIPHCMNRCHLYILSIWKYEHCHHVSVPFGNLTATSCSAYSIQGRKAPLGFRRRWYFSLGSFDKGAWQLFKIVSGKLISCLATGPQRKRAGRAKNVRGSSVVDTATRPAWINLK